MCGVGCNAQGSGRIVDNPSPTRFLVSKWGSVHMAGGSGAIILMTEEGQAWIVSPERLSRAWAGLRLWKVPATLGYPDRSRGGESR
jgi:hypothetical protein